MSKVFQVQYDSEDQLVNIPNDLGQRIAELRKLKSQGYTHVKDKFWIQLTGKLATINDYITENVSYL
tara:strand:+ start:1247 stop:1447 length:201 start_codon:yes stop_codon:yes gene_type:complete